MIEAKGQNGTVRFDGRMVTLVRSGFVARRLVGKGDKAIPLRLVSAVQFREATALRRGYIELTIAGAVERSGRNAGDQMSNENAVVFLGSQGHAFAAVRDAILTAMAELA